MCCERKNWDIYDLNDSILLSWLQLIFPQFLSVYPLRHSELKVLAYPTPSSSLLPQ